MISDIDRMPVTYQSGLHAAVRHGQTMPGSTLRSPPRARPLKGRAEIDPKCVLDASTGCEWPLPSIVWQGNLGSLKCYLGNVGEILQVEIM